MNTHDLVLMARDWANIYQRKAIEYTGMIEGAEYLAHSKRYTTLADALEVFTFNKQDYDNDKYA